MLIPYITAWNIQIVSNILIVILLIYLLTQTLRLIYRVRYGKEKDKRGYIKKMLIYSGILLLIFILINIFFEYDPFNMIEDLLKLKDLGL